MLDYKNPVLSPPMTLKGTNTPILTAIRYRSMVDPMPIISHSSRHQASENSPSAVQNAADFAARCLAIGIGPECKNLVRDLGQASWFEHLRETIVYSDLASELTEANEEASSWLLNSLPHPHVASIAMSEMITSKDVELACVISRLLMRHHTFVVITSSSNNSRFAAQLGQACDCLVSGDGSQSHHQYPIRTLIEPASGHLICYDLHDVCCVWAGHSGEYDVFRSDADALHVEISTQAGSLSDIDAIANSYRIQLDDHANLKLFNAVDGLGQRQSAPISFCRNSRI